MAETLNYRNNAIGVQITSDRPSVRHNRAERGVNTQGRSVAGNIAASNPTSQAT